MEKGIERVPKLILTNPPSIPTSAIVLFGGNSCGKSTTLLHLIVLLCGGGALNKSVQAAFEHAFYYPKHDNYKDVDVVVYYRSQKGEKVPIYISTDGDTWPIVEDNFRFFYHCIRTRHKVYEFKNNKFIQHDHISLKFLKRPVICITAANFTQFGGTQAAHYYLDLTCEDWKSKYWIRKYPCSNPGQPIPDYTYPRIKRIKDEDDKQAKRLLSLINNIIN